MGSPGPPMRSRRQSKHPCRPRPGVRWGWSLVGWRGAAVLPVPSGPQHHRGALRDHSPQVMTLTAATPRLRPAEGALTPPCPRFRAGCLRTIPAQGGPADGAVGWALGGGRALPRAASLLQVQGSERVGTRAGSQEAQRSDGVRPLSGPHTVCLPAQLCPGPAHRAEHHP